MAVKPVNPKSWTSWVRASDGYLRSDDPYGLYGTTTPELPRNYVDTTYSLPTGGTTHTPANSAAFATALTNAVLGDVIVLDKTVTYVGPFTLPNKTGSGWIYIISNDLASLPSYGEAWANCVGYVSGDPSNIANWNIATHAALMPKITGATSGDSNAITNASSAHHYRFVGCEIKNSGSLTNVTATVGLGSGDTSNSTVPHHIIFDRCYIHGSTSATAPGIRGVQMNGENLACVGCYIADYFVDGADTQAVWTRQGNGPFKVVNNFLQASGENVMYGGADPTIANSVPSDIEIRHNLFYKPTSWVGGLFDIKNLLEFKNAQRVLVEGNIFRNNWASAQSGMSILITPRNQSNGAPWSVTKDITIRLNKMIGTGGGFSIAGRDDTYSSQVTYRVLVENNLVIADANNGSDAYGFLISHGIQYLSVKHNTIISGSFPFYSTSSNSVTKCDGAIFRDNMIVGGTVSTTLFEFAGDSYLGSVAIFANYYLNSVYDHNALVKGDSGQYSGTNYFPANVAAVGFTNYAGADYSLTVGSTYHNAASDGADIGCNFTALAAAIA